MTRTGPRWGILALLAATTIAIIMIVTFVTGAENDSQCDADNEARVELGLPERDC